MELHNIGALSEAGYRFYRLAMQSVSDYNVRRIFRQRFDIYQQLLSLATHHKLLSGSPVNQSVQASIDWFTTAQDVVHGFDNPIFLDLLEAQEEATLQRLKKSVKDASDQHLSRQLAKYAAAIQVNRDELLTLKIHYLSQTRHNQPAQL